MSIVVLRGSNLENKLELIFFYQTSTQSYVNDKMLPSTKRGAIYVFNSTHKSQNHCFFLNLFEEALQFDATVPTTTHIPYGFTPTNTCPTKNSNGTCLRFDALECHANLQINWESFLHRDQQKYMFKI
jgi:hypothetical protein